MRESEQILRDHGIQLDSYTPGRHYALCPECSHRRSTAEHRKAKVLGVTIDHKGVHGGCNHCGWTFGNGRANLTHHVYRDAAGVERFRKVRNAPGREPRFWVERPDGKGGWRKGTKGVDTSILYRVDQVNEAVAHGRPIAVVEGEKDADRLWSIGVPATCNAHGASEPGKDPKWKPHHSEQLRGANIVVFNDNDEPGYAHADTACKLSLGVANTVRRLDLKPHWPEIGNREDVSDWLEKAGGNREKLDALMAAAPPYAGGANSHAQVDDQQPKSWKDGIITARALQAKQFKPVRIILPEVIPEGVTILAGKPKVGKSWLALDVCVAVAGHRLVLGDKRPVEGDALYLALEDNQRRLQKRIDKVMQHMPAPERLDVHTEWKRVDQGGLEDIEAWLKSKADPRLIWIDTLAKIRPLTTGRNEQAYAADYRAIEGLQRLAGQYQVGIVLNHHLRKAASEDDAFDDVSGTLGLTGAADTCIVMKRHSGMVKIYVRGRDIEESEFALKFNRDECRWRLMGAAEDVFRSQQRQAVIAALKDANRPLSVSELMAATDQTDRNAMRQLLYKMRNAGEVEMAGRNGLYRLPPGDPLDAGNADNAGNGGNGLEPELDLGVTGVTGDLGPVTQPVTQPGGT
jgi:hypothetical protein